MEYLYKKCKALYICIILLMAGVTSSAFMLKLTAVKVDMSKQMYKLGRLCLYLSCSVRRDDIASFLLVVLFAVLLYKMAKQKYLVRTKCFAATISILFHMVWIVCESYARSNSLDLIFCSNYSIVRAGIIFAGKSLLGYYVLCYVFEKFLGRFHQLEINKSGIFHQFRITRISVFLVIILAWMPYVFIFYPANVGADATDEIAQLHNDKDNSWTYSSVTFDESATRIINNHHPVAYTMIIGVFLKMGKVMGSANVGIFLLALFQMVLLAMTYSYVINFMKRIGTPEVVLLGAILFFMFFPILPLYAITITKDTLFSITMIRLTVAILELVIDEKAVLGSKRRMAEISSCMVCMTLLRNNGLHIILGVFIILLCVYRKQAKKIAIMFGIPILLYSVLFLKVLLPFFQIPNGSPREMLSVPMQQIARYAKEWGEEGFEEGEVEQLNRLLDFDNDINNLVKCYNPILSDPVKDLYRKEADSNDYKAFLEVWKELFLRHPGTFIEATINNNAYLFSSYYSYGMAYYCTIDSAAMYDISNPVKLKSVRESVKSIIEHLRYSGAASWIFSIGLWDYIILLSLAYLIYRKQYKFLLASLPVVINVAICMAGPIIYMRYAFQWIAVVPVFIAMVCYVGRQTAAAK